ncbi:S41 family peptidase [Rhodanobacter sp. Si-c]|uniref:S41 family peptidase n=1 Tax=Rhodanobacter lycopersici TaxID=3162487 RepID=A0ABV3QGQ4_9GAMM
MTAKVALHGVGSRSGSFFRCAVIAAMVALPTVATAQLSQSRQPSRVLSLDDGHGILQAMRGGDAKASGRHPPETALDADHQFDAGSGIAIHKLDGTQTENLVTLGKVWGFLKYYDPAITSGQRQWDYELFRVLPGILAAGDRASANAVIVKWIDGLGPVARCQACATVDKHDLQFGPDLGWIADTRLLGKALSRKLLWIRDQRRPGTQFYVALAPAVGNPAFQHEPSYGDVHFPDSGFQLLALFRYWNIIEYWYPDRNVIGEDWDKVLATFIPKLALAKDRTGYQLQLMALIAEVHDTHANLWSSLNVRPPVGHCHLPVRLRFVQHQAVVTGIEDMWSAMAVLKIGDVITRLDDRPISALVKEWSPYYADSNEAARLRDMATYMTRGSCNEIHLMVRGGGQELQLKASRVLLPGDYLAIAFHDLPGPGFRLLSPEVAYLKLSSASASRVADDIRQAAGTRGLVIDARNYPSEFMVFALGSLLVDRPTPFARFTVGDLSNPGAFHWTPPLILEPKAPHYHGKVVILVDEVTQSSAEYTAMAFRAAPGALVVGSTTAGADGNASRIPLPGNLFTVISGIGVFYPDQRPTQRVGIVPDVVVEPTIAAIRDGRDPVLEEALRLILGPKTPISSIEGMYRSRPH